jgi:hypothetical protein
LFAKVIEQKSSSVIRLKYEIARKFQNIRKQISFERAKKSSKK